MTQGKTAEQACVYRISGGRPLMGTVQTATAKNSVLPLLAATLLCGEPCELRTVPHLRDVETSLALQNAVGAHAEWQGNSIVTKYSADISGVVPSTQASAMRASIFYLAPLLCRAGRVHMPLPGGCNLGPRPIDIHLAGLAAMGAHIEQHSDAIEVCCEALRAADFTLRLPSVGATLTLMMAACCAAGTTVLRGAAAEPEIVDVADFLTAAGAKIEGAGTPVLTICGRAACLPRGTAYTPMPDRVAAATYAAAAAAAGGWVRIEKCRPKHLQPFLQMLQNCGCEVVPGGDNVTVARTVGKPLRGGASIATAAYPGFATDMSPLAAAVLLNSVGKSTIYDSLFQERFACAAGFAALGADITVQGRTLYINSQGRPLQGAHLTATDLRGGAALLLAALAAQGESTLMDAGHITRGYENLAAVMTGLGAKCKKIK